MKKDIKEILKKHSMIQDQSNGFRLYSLHKDRWDDVVKDIEELINKKDIGIELKCETCSSDISKLGFCPPCDTDINFL
jgi:hypothetical protein